jgi:hypothetical protein
MPSKPPVIKSVGEYIPWLELLDIHTASENWVDKWLATSELGGNAANFHVDTGGTGLRLPDQPLSPRQAAVRTSQGNWDRDVVGVKSHVAEILSQLGNAKKPTT